MSDAHEQHFQQALTDLINTFAKENDSDTPDFILAMYISDCLKAYNNATCRREAWYGRATEAADPPEEEGDATLTVRHTVGVHQSE